MPTRYATAVWEGSAQEGKGLISLQSEMYEGPYTFASRWGEEAGTNPEELLGAAHAGCFAMYLAALLSKNGYHVLQIKVTGDVTLSRSKNGPVISAIMLTTEADIPGIDFTQFMRFAEMAKAVCPMTKALTGIPKIQLKAELVDLTLR